MNTHEILDLIAQTYTKDTRSVTFVPNKELVCIELNGLKGFGSCRYNGPDGKHCAFAMMVENPEILPEGKSCDAIMKNLGDKIKFKEGFGGHEQSFYKDCQTLHDNSDSWNENGLSEKGEQYLSILKEMHPITSSTTNNEKT